MSSDGSALMQDEPVLDGEQLDGLIAAAGVDGTRDILDAFQRSTDTLLAALKDQLAAGDLCEAVKTAHALKGSALNVGALSLSISARAIEEACRTGDAGAALANLVQAGGRHAEASEAFAVRLAGAAA